MAVKKETVRAGFHEAMGIVLLAACIIGILSLFSFDPKDIALLRNPPNDPPSNFIGPVGAWFGFLTFMTFGVCGYLVPAAFAYLGLLCFYRRDGRIWPKAVWLLAMFVTLCCLMELGPGAWRGLTEKINSVGAGGALGDVVGRRVLVSLMGSVGTGILAVALFLVSLVMIFEVNPAVLVGEVRAWIAARRESLAAERREQLPRVEQLKEESRDLLKKQSKLERAVKTYERATAMQDKAEEPASVAPASRRAPKAEPKPETAKPLAAEPEREPEPIRKPDPAAAPEPEPEAPAPLVEQAVDLIKKVRARTVRPSLPKEKEQEELVTVAAALPQTNVNFTLPPLSFLDPLPPPKERELTGDFELGSQLLKETLAEFGIDVEVTNVERGPVVTRYELLPAAGVRVERIVNLSNNIGLAMKADRKSVV